MNFIIKVLVACILAPFALLGLVMCALPFMARAGEIPVVEELARAIADPCNTKLELFVIGPDEAYLGCPGCTSLGLHDIEDDKEIESLQDALRNARNIIPFTEYDLLIFRQLAQDAEFNAAMPLFSRKIGGESFADIAHEKGLCD